MKFFKGSSKDEHEISETSCQCPKNVPCCQSADNIKSVLAAIEKTAGDMNIPGFSVDVDITTDNGVIYPIAFTEGVHCPVKVTETLIKGKNFAISLNSITKIIVYTAKIKNPQFVHCLKKELDRIMTGRSGCNVNCASQYAQSVQNYINQNSDRVSAIGYTGSGETTQDIVIMSDIKTVDVIAKAELDVSTDQVVSRAGINTEKLSVVSDVLTTTDRVVTEIKRTPKSVVTGIISDKTDVSGPVTLEKVNVVTDVTANAPKDIVTQVNSTTVAVNNVTDVTTDNAATDFGTFVQNQGVITGITSANAVKTKECNVSTFTIEGEGGEGQLQIVIPANKFGRGIPPENVTIPITCSGGECQRKVLFSGCEKCYGFASQTTVIGNVTGEPVIKNISVPANLTKKAFVNGVTRRPVDVAGPVTVKTDNGSLVSKVTKKDINSASQPRTISVVEKASPVMGEVSNITSVESTVLGNLIKTFKKDVVESASVTNEKVNAVTDVDLKKTVANVVKSATTSTVSVMVPACENIHGEVDCAGNGIVTVDKKDGNLAVYNTCDINTVKKQ